MAWEYGVILWYWAKFSLVQQTKLILWWTVTLLYCQTILCVQVNYAHISGSTTRPTDINGNNHQVITVGGIANNVTHYQCDCHQAGNDQWTLGQPPVVTSVSGCWCPVAVYSDVLTSKLILNNHNSRPGVSGVSERWNRDPFHSAIHKDRLLQCCAGILKR